MKDYIKNELVCLRAMEPVGCDRYNELSDAIQWLEENTIKKPSDGKKVTVHNFAFTTIQWKDDGKKEDVVIKLSPYELADEKIDEAIFYYCENEEEFESLKHFDNGQDFVVIGCTIYSESI